MKMRQVNMRVNDDVYKVLVKLAAEKQLKTQELVSLGSIAADILTPILLNGIDAKPDNKQEDPPKTKSIDSELDGKPPQSSDLAKSFDFAKMDF